MLLGTAYQPRPISAILEKFSWPTGVKMPILQALQAKADRFKNPYSRSSGSVLDNLQFGGESTLSSIQSVYEARHVEASRKAVDPKNWTVW
jgi:hypothetical protein